MQRLELWFVRVNQWVVATLLAVMFIIVFLNVVLRYGFGMSLSWAEESARFLMIAGAFIGAGLALREGRLVAIDMVQLMLPQPLRHALRWAIAIVLILFMAALVYFGIKFVAFGWSKETMATQIPRGVPYLAIPVGASLFIIHMLIFLRRYVRGDFDYTIGEER